MFIFRQIIVLPDYVGTIQNGSQLRDFLKLKIFTTFVVSSKVVMDGMFRNVSQLLRTTLLV